MLRLCMLEWSLAIGLLSLGMLATSAEAKDEKDDPVVAYVKEHVKDPKKPFTLIVSFKVKEGANDKFEAAFAKAIKGSRQEKGCITYDLNRDDKDSTKYQVYERWKSVSDLDAHTRTEHIKALRAVMPDLVVEGSRELRVMVIAGE